MIDVSISQLPNLLAERFGVALLTRVRTRHWKSPAFSGLTKKPVGTASDPEKAARAKLQQRLCAFFHKHTAHNTHRELDSIH